MRRMVLAFYRIRGPLYYLAAAILIGNAIAGRYVTSDGIRELLPLLVLLALALAVLCLLATFLVPGWLPEQATRVVASPVRGRWLGLNSPASAVPSHGVRAYGQAYAIDLAHTPADAARPEFGGPMMRPAAEYPAFGQPVLAMIDGTVVRASDWRRDHRARSNGWGAGYLMLEGVVRELGGPGFIVGNHLVIRGDDGVYAAVAHLQRGSLAVRRGERVTAGTPVGRCGNSGNSSEPHVHAQLMDRASFWTAQGIPMAFAEIAVGDDPAPREALPANGQPLTA
ncbi:MAG: M23 family peptidase [Leifsonia xyli]|nr:MAG: M23 family peptidase [Leifsonia xyli]